MEKVIRDGMVAVLYSPGFGAGWSTWNDAEMEYLLFHPEIVAAVEKEDYTLAAALATRIGKELYGGEKYICVLGASDLRIGWVPEGEAFDIPEYDGSEGLEIISENSYRKA